jgi:hypothetical protein
MKAVRDTPSSDGVCVYEVSSNYVERIKRYAPDKQKVNGQTDGQTDGRTDNPRHTIIRPVDDGRIIIVIKPSIVDNHGARSTFTIVNSFHFIVIYALLSLDLLTRW